MHYHWGQTVAKKERGHFKQRTSKQKKQSNFDIGWNDNRAVYLVSSKSSESKRFVRRLNKVETKYIQEQQPN